MSRRSTRNTDNKDKTSVEEETSQWEKVAQMIGSSLEEVCNMGAKERNHLLSLLHADNNQFVDVNQILSEDKKLASSSDPGQGSSTDESASAQHSPFKKFVKKLNKFVEVVWYGAQASQIQDLDGKARNEDELNTSLNKSKSSENNDKFETPYTSIDNSKFQTPNASTEKEIYKRAKIKDFSMEIKEIEADNNGLEMVGGSKPSKACSVASDNYDKIIGSVIRLKDFSEFDHDEIRKNVTDKLLSSANCFKMMEESPEKYKFNINKVFDNTMKKHNTDGSLKDIFTLFSGVKQIKSFAVASFEEELPLVNVSPDSSVTNGFKALSPNRSRKNKSVFEESGFISPDTDNTLLMEILKEQRTDGLGRTRASTRASTTFSTYPQHSYNVDHQHDHEPFCDVDEYEFDGDVDDNDYEETSKKQGKMYGKGIKIEGKVNRKRKSSDGEASAGSSKGKAKATGRGKKARKDSSETQPFIDDSLATPGSSGTSIRITGSHQISVEEFETSVESSNIGRHERREEESYNIGLHQTTLGALAISSEGPGLHQTTLGTQTISSEEPDSSSPESTPTIKFEFETCPSCQRPFLLSQVEKHLDECKGGVSKLEENEFCDICALMVEKSTFKAHQDECIGFQTLQQRIQKKM